MERQPRGYVFEASNACHVSYYVNEIVNGEPKRVQRSQRLRGEDRDTGHGSKTAKAVRQLAEHHLRTINATVASTTDTDMSVVDSREEIPAIL
jgi:hypothetical protein